MFAGVLTDLRNFQLSFQVKFWQFLKVICFLQLEDVGFRYLFLILFLTVLMERYEKKQSITSKYASVLLERLPIKLKILKVYEPPIWFCPTSKRPLSGGKDPGKQSPDVGDGRYLMMVRKQGTMIL